MDPGGGLTADRSVGRVSRGGAAMRRYVTAILLSLFALPSGAAAETFASIVERVYELSI